MKKLLITSLSLFMLAIPATSCVVKNNNINQIKQEDSEFKLYTNKSIKKMLEVYTKKDKSYDLYIDQQENKPYSKYDELRFALTFYPIFNSINVRHNSQYEGINLTAKSVIENTLSNDWYWVINNIDKFQYTFNPYGDYYKKIDDIKINGITYNDEFLFNKTKELFKSSVQKIKNKAPIELITFDIKDITDKDLKELKTQTISDKLDYSYVKFEEKSIYKKKQAWYLVFDNYKVLKIWKYEFNNKVYLKILPDLLILKNSNNIKQLKQQLENLEKMIHKKRVDELNRKIKIEKENFDPEDYGIENGSDFKFSIQQYLDKRYKDNDESFMKFQETHQYNDILMQSINEINKEALQRKENTKHELDIFRFSMRYIYG
ncbi:aromatic motif membrane protein [Mycoplasma leachii]|uniref:Putative lipoprotein n=1 Tax=Mycoplasma leachii 06049 TaxID=1188244 RepID=A0A2T4IAQ7_9MOLU|nr:aromatic motif membrane protein [Mycoplasma leachii]PTD31754.1 putative lipoprotein [Mycoplasma leachii 06049]